jgi:hypothetical protein
MQKMPAIALQHENWALPEYISDTGGNQGTVKICQKNVKKYFRGPNKDSTKSWMNKCSSLCFETS